MPANPILQLNDVIETTWESKELGSNAQIINRMAHAVSFVPASPVDTLQQAVAACDSRYNTSILGILCQEVSRFQTVTRLLTNPVASSGGARWVSVNQALVLSSGFGGGATQPLPNFNSASVRLITGYSGRYWRGGMRLGTIPVTYLDSNSDRLTGISVSTIGAAVTSFRADITLPGGTILTAGLASAKYGVDFGFTVPFDSFSPYVAHVVNPFIRTVLSRQAPHVP